VVAVKPIARWQIWLGKWLGLLMLNAALLPWLAAVFTRCSSGGPIDCPSISRNFTQ